MTMTAEKLAKLALLFLPTTAVGQEPMGSAQMWGQCRRTAL